MECFSAGGRTSTKTRSQKLRKAQDGGEREMEKGKKRKAEEEAEKGYKR